MQRVREVWKDAMASCRIFLRKREISEILVVFPCYATQVDEVLVYIHNFNLITIKFYELPSSLSYRISEYDFQLYVHT